MHQHDATAQGTSQTPAPSWPSVQVTGCTRIGCTREGARSESYSLQLQLDGGGSKTCTVPQARWQQVEDNSRWKVKVGVMLGQVDCNAMTPL